MLSAMLSSKGKQGKGSSFIAKKVRNRIYIYRVFKSAGKTREEYLAPFDEIAKFYLRWCGGRDSNPGRPTPAEPQSAPFDLARAPPLGFNY